MRSEAEGFFRAVRSAYETLVICAPTVVDAQLHRMTMDVADARLEQWSRRLLEVARIRLTVSGRENFDPARTYLLMSNHASHFDVPVIFQAYKRPVRMVAKKELFAIPVFGSAMRAAGFPEVDRKNRAKAIEALQRGTSLFNQGISLWIAPEGTRSKTGELGSFKKGGFVLALERQMAILPVGLAGTRDVLAPGTVDVHPSVHVHAHFGAPIEPGAQEYSGEARDALMQKTEQALRAVIATAREQRAKQ
ncbi:MAG: lysophospholipid acyltransferase family protein [Polyangiales bacterium]